MQPAKTFMQLLALNNMPHPRSSSDAHVVRQIRDSGETHQLDLPRLVPLILPAMTASLACRTPQVVAFQPRPAQVHRGHVQACRPTSCSVCHDAQELTATWPWAAVSGMQKVYTPQHQPKLHQDDPSRVMRLMSHR